ncbi:putative metal ion transporter C17A12.14 [Choanephora cucurbitarum]|uniref:Putative metal ion transporter C17A12.14 n=1 Tax=Choanephora cucurbitarum TaxID=101091 RepID=A0A1C7N3I2_9FUNG|nr:putative metal ion transporter C17A12.14 [Choanephora cucurbitarum]
MPKPKKRQHTQSKSQRQRESSQSENALGNNSSHITSSSFQPLNMFFGGSRSSGYQAIASDEDRPYLSRSPIQDDVAINMNNNAPEQYHSDIETSSNSPTSSVEVDVCFPTPNKKDEEGIDYEALEEYVKQEKQETFEQKYERTPRRRRLSTLGASDGRRYSMYGDRMLGRDESKSETDYRVTYYSAHEASTIHARSICEIPDGNENETLTDMLKKGCFWIDILNPTDNEMKALCKVFHIHPLTVEDISMEEQREKCEVFMNYYFICFRSFDQDEFSLTYMQPIAIYIIILKEGVITFHFKSMPHPHNVRKRIKQLKDYINVTPDWICYGILDDITDSFAPLIRAIEFEVDSIDELVLILKESEQSDMLRRIGYCRKRMMGLLRLLSSKTDVVKTLVKRGEVSPDGGTRPALSKEVALYLGDVQDHIISMLLSLNHYEKISSRSHSNYLAQISIEMTQTNNEINDVLSKLTALGSVLVPMNLVTGLFGMNVQVPGQFQEDLTWFVGIMMSILVFCIISTILMRYYNIV